MSQQLPQQYRKHGRDDAEQKLAMNYRYRLSLLCDGYNEMDTKKGNKMW